MLPATPSVHSPCLQHQHSNVCLSAARCLPAVCPLSVPATSTQQCLSVSSTLPATLSVHSPCLQHQHSNVCLSPALCLPHCLSTLRARNIITAMSVCLQHPACHTVSTLCACNINTFGVDTEPHTLRCTSPSSLLHDGICTSQTSKAWHAPWCPRMSFF